MLPDIAALAQCIHLGTTIEEDEEEEDEGGQKEKEDKKRRKRKTQLKMEPPQFAKRTCGFFHTGRRKKHAHAFRIGLVVFLKKGTFRKAENTHTHLKRPWWDETHTHAF